jgi:hypothetical protein
MKMILSDLILKIAWWQDIDLMINKMRRDELIDISYSNLSNKFDMVTAVNNQYLQIWWKQWEFND